MEWLVGLLESLVNGENDDDDDKNKKKYYMSVALAS